ncbi:unnamed protein product [Acanthosepion pharaonis]|uniref:Peptidase A2 domain-containing protein n=1 Tax=Acanthosepion pharaonis TaxID=158019 RepID=A0A812DKD9_ACAPH|nr:unnamed protein product [Sepia pharaonis]
MEPGILDPPYTPVGSRGEYKPQHWRQLTHRSQHAMSSILLDTGAAISVIPYQERPYFSKPTLLKLQAANGSAIDTYGERTLTLNIGMRRDFTWTFTVANVKIPILGADFLAHYELAVYMNPRTLFDTTTNLHVFGTPTRQSSTGISVATCHGDHQTQHHIRTRGPPTFSPPATTRSTQTRVLRRTDMHLTIRRANTTDTVAIDRTKPFFLEKQQFDANPAPRTPNATPAHPAHAAPQTSDDTPATPVQQTKSDLSPAAGEKLDDWPIWWTPKPYLMSIGLGSAFQTSNDMGSNFISTVCYSL